MRCDLFAPQNLYPFFFMETQKIKIIMMYRLVNEDFVSESKFYELFILLNNVSESHALLWYFIVTRPFQVLYHI